MRSSESLSHRDSIRSGDGAPAESPIFVHYLDQLQRDRAVVFAVYHGGHGVVDFIPTWDASLTSVQGLLIECSCGDHVTLERGGEN